MPKIDQREGMRIKQKYLFHKLNDREKNKELTQGRMGELKRTTLILMIATFSSKAISFILAPLYSYYLDPSSYGTIDIILTTASLLLPIVVGGIYEGIFRFANDPKEDKRAVFTNSMVIAFLGGILCGMFIFPFFFFIQKSIIVIFVYLYAVIDGFIYTLGGYERGIGNIKVFALSGIISTVCQLMFTFIFIVGIRWGINGWYIACIMSKIITLFYLALKVSVRDVLDRTFISVALQKKLLKYCLPLIPSTIMWWVTNVSDRYVIGLFLGVSSNGIYAVANKLPALLNVLEEIFYKAWQSAAIDSVDDEDRNHFYSEVFNNYYLIMLSGYIVLIMLAKPIIIYLFEESYSSAWMYIPPLLAGVVVHAMAGNLGTYYVVFYNTKGALITSVWGALANLILNIIFIPQFGLFAAALTTLMGYIVIFILRWYNIRRYVLIKVNLKRSFGMTGLGIIQTILYFQTTLVSKILMLAVIIIMIAFNWKMVVKMIKRK